MENEQSVRKCEIAGLQKKTTTTKCKVTCPNGDGSVMVDR